MGKVRANLLRLVGLITVLAVVAVGCGGGGGGGGAAGDVDLSGAEIAVGSKEFTEQLILGQITLQVLENAGATVEDQIGLAGTVAARKALLAKSAAAKIRIGLDRFELLITIHVF